MDDLLCLTIHQPWAWAIVTGAKTVENRSWTTRYRGPIGVHAGLSRVSMVDAARVFLRAGVRLPSPAETIRGALVGFVDVVDVMPLREYRRDPRTRSGEAFASGPFCWILRNPRELPRPIPLRGRQGLFRVPASELPRSFRPLAAAVRSTRS